jgi:PAS domain S-box-containing protein
MNARLRSPLAIWLAQVIGLAVAVYVVGRLGRVSDVSPGQAVSLWTNSGVVLAAFLFFGNRIWPGAWLGGFLVELAPSLSAVGWHVAAAPLAYAGTVATGTVLQAAVANWVIRRSLGKAPTLDSVNEILALMGLGGLVTTVIGATARSATLIGGSGPLLTWPILKANWAAELTGVFVFAPVTMLVLGLKVPSLHLPRIRRIVESVILFVVIPVVVSQIKRESDYGIILMTGSALWATLRFGKAGTGLNVVTMAMMLAANVGSGILLLGSIKTNPAAAAGDAQILQSAFCITFWSLAALLDERERVAKELRENEARFRQFSEGMSHVIWMMTPDKYHFLYLNRAFEQIYGLSREDLYDSSGLWLACIHPEDRQRVSEARWGRSGAGEYCEEYRVVRSDKTVRWVRETAVPLRNEQGEIVMFGGIVEDITQSRQVAQELARHQSELLHVSRLSSVGQMIATLSHEVAQPMSAIGTFATVCSGLLESKTDGSDRHETVKKCVEAIAAENQRCRAILRRLRDYTRKAPLQRTACDVNAVLRESVDLIVHELRRHEVKVRYELVPATALVSGDRIQLQQVVINLLTNARDAMLHTDPPRRVVRLRSRIEDGFVVVDVADQGLGLPPDQNGGIFEPFFTTKAAGMGIGLSICKTIVEEHGGEIQASRNEFGGATFRIRIPSSDHCFEDANASETDVAQVRAQLERVDGDPESAKSRADARWSSDPDGALARGDRPNAD